MHVRGGYAYVPYSSLERVIEQDKEACLRPRAPPNAGHDSQRRPQESHEMTEDDEARRLRAATRRDRISISHGADGADAVRGAAAVSLVTMLTRTAWSLSGQPWPAYARAHIPCRFFRGWPE